MKNSYSSHDVKCLVNEFQKYVGLYLDNIYDIDSHQNKTFVFKFKGNPKVYILMESGRRLHTLDSFNADNTEPKSLCVKMRKHISGWKLNKIQQVNYDRVIDFQFGHDEKSFHVILELYASGNIIFTDHDYIILGLIHHHYYEDKIDEETKRIYEVSPGKKYPIDKATLNKSVFDIDESAVNNWITTIRTNDKMEKLRDYITKSPMKNYGTVLVEHCISSQGISTKAKYGKGKTLDTLNSYKLIADLKSFLIDNNEQIEGYIIKDNTFVPYLYDQLKDTEYVRYPTFDSALKEWFGSSLKKVSIEKKSKDKIIKTKTNKADMIVFHIEQNIKTLMEKQDKIITIIDVIGKNSDLLNEVITIANNREINNNLIQKYKIDYNYKMKTVKIAVDNEGVSIEVTLNWSLTLNANIQKLYDSLKIVNTKMITANNILESHRKKVNKQIKQKEIIKQTEPVESKQNETIKIQRKQFWFEKFNWFISSDGNLVISGKDAQMNDAIYNKYMKNNDIYVHSDEPGSGSCIVKNIKSFNMENTDESENNTDQEDSKDSKDTTDNIDFGVRTIEEVGSFVVCHTKAWSSPGERRSYWVKPDQVSKTTQTGEFIKTGSFIVRGTKNYIPPKKMTMGFGILFFDGKKLNKKFDSESKFAVVICCPYSVLLNYQFKKKIEPGNCKIGQSINLVIDSICKEATGLAKTMIKNIPNEDWHRVAPGKFKVI